MKSLLRLATSLGLIATLFILQGCTQDKPTTNINDIPHTETNNNQEICLNNGGVWIASVNECENISSDICTEFGGTYNECGSACRNNPEADMCIMMCVPFCSL